MYMLLGHLTEILGCDTWENLLKTKLFYPIGMNSSKVLLEPRDTQQKGVARPYIYRNDKFENSTLEIYQ